MSVPAEHDIEELPDARGRRTAPSPGDARATEPGTDAASGLETQDYSEAPETESDARGSDASGPPLPRHADTEPARPAPDAAATAAFEPARSPLPWAEGERPSSHATASFDSNGATGGFELREPAPGPAIKV